MFANKTSHYVASWYRQPGGTSGDFQLYRDQLDHIRNQHKGKKLPSIHVLGDFNFRDIDWPDRFNKSASALSQSEGQMLIDIMNDYGLEQLVHFPTREKRNTLDLLLTSLPGQFQDIHSPDKLSDHGIYCCWNFESWHSPNLGERCIYIRKMIMNLWGKMHLNLQRKSISTVIQILARYKRTLTLLLLLFRIRRINTSHQKLVERTLRLPGLPRN